MASEILKTIQTVWGFLSVFVVCSAAVSIVFMILRFARLRTKWFSLNVDRQQASGEGSEDDQKTVSTTKSPRHYGCPHADDLLEVSKRTAELDVRRESIKRQVYAEQLKYANEKIDEAIAHMQRIVIKLINEKTHGVIPFVQHPDYTTFKAIAKGLVHDVRAYLSYRFTENHYAFYTAQAQLDYVDERRTKITQMVTDLLNDYWCCQSVTRAELYDNNKEKRAEYDEIITSIFNEAFRIARDGQERIETAESEYASFMTNLSGTTYKVEDATVGTVA